MNQKEGSGTPSPKTNTFCRPWSAKTMIQMNLLKFPMNRVWVIIILIFSHNHKTTAAFVIGKLLLLFDLNILKTYRHFLRKHLYIFALCILTSKQFRKIHRKLPVPEPRFYLSCMKKRLRNICFSVNFEKLLRILFYRTPLGECFCRLWLEVVRDVLALFLKTDFKEC